MSSSASARRLRILHVILNLGEANGQYNEHCLPMADVRDLSICTYLTPELTPPSSIALFPGDGSLVGFFRALRGALDAERYDIVHVHAPPTGALVVVALLGWLRYRRLRSRLVYTVQDSFYDYTLRNQALMVIALAGFRRIIFCSRAAYASLPRVWKRLVRGRWRVVQNGADIERIDRALTASPPTHDDTVFTIVCVGRLEPVKDPFTVLDAFAASNHDRSRLVFIGAGTLEPAVRARVDELGLGDRVELTGLVSRDEVFVLCAAADVLVSASHGEGLPVAVIEAMASRCPVILSDIPPHRELVDGAEFVPLVDVGDADGYARQIRRFRDMSPTALRDLGKRGREHVVARYALPIMHAGVDAVYRDLPAPAAPTTQ
ncbi:MAG TPA: glycosyltransferase family 4 protein [Euzebyales bacterium]|nr:glycosyltransferase family 4 protein [Euzebyales bacterium]